MKLLIQKKTKQAFTLIELLVVVGILALLFGLCLPALAKSKNRSPAAGCLSNLRQMQAACAMYADDYNGALMPNAPASATPISRMWCGGSENWFTALPNTNAASYLPALMGQYVSSNLTVLHCPGDLVPSANGQRIRSYSMNGQMGAANGFSNPNSGWRQYTYEYDLTCPAPSDAFIFCDEHPGSLNDGYIQGNLNTPSFPDVPASYLEGGCGFSFADGHAEIHKWRTQTLLIPVVAGATIANLSASGSNADWLWLRSHSACK
jgi:prepilin-type N-terminal cleavage/methylation domain-containing protein/prepilin-type processing-associated H-X9-DG protein